MVQNDLAKKYIMGSGIFSLIINAIYFVQNGCYQAAFYLDLI